MDFSLSQGEEYLGKCAFAERESEIKPDSIVVGDAFEALKKIREKSVDLLFVDPPYNLTKNYHGNEFRKRADDEYEKFTLKWINAVKPALKDTASVYVCCDWKSSLVIGRILGENFVLRNRITWQREKGRGAKNNWKNGMEDVYFATVGDRYFFNLDQVKTRKRVVAPYKEDGKPKDWAENESGKYRDTCPSNFWDDVTVPYWSMKENTAHPTQKPEKLVAKIILASSRKGDLVLDPFSGSGTTSVVAKKLGRRFIGLEQNALYCAWAQKRLCDAEDDKKIQGYENGVFFERNYKPSAVEKQSKSPRKTVEKRADKNENDIRPIEDER